jgi:hypothetical protein
VDRRGLILAGGALATAVVLGSAGEALAKEDVADVLVGQVASHRSPDAIDLVEFGGSRGVLVQTTADTDIVTSDGTRRPLDAVGVGETVVVVAPSAATCPSGHVLNARRVLPCVIGNAADVRH